MSLTQPILAYHGEGVHILRPRRFQALEDIERFREIRNAGASSYPPHAAFEIPYEDNVRFWAYAKDVQAWIFDDLSGKSVGIGSLRRRGRRLWAFTAVDPKEHGKGFGTAILRYLTAQSNQDVWAVTRADNVGAQSIHRKAGNWKTTKTVHGLVYWVCRKP